MMRVGHGMDAHRLVEGRPLVLCGVTIPHEMGLLGHSDADVATHALMDALLGAAALGDLGKLFPDDEDRYQGVRSMNLLRTVIKRVAGAGYEPVNVDVTIVAQRPKLRPYVDAMRDQLAKTMDLPMDSVSVKATTTERMGFEGSEEGISAQAVCMIRKRNDGQENGASKPYGII
ncbi:MAG: 2-C-methyl-D-erythritol 2,4-cyclodiphosphate synthase [Clostridia bacterium]|nr:2-C-methyl-D-erythritol 2,4-cyclodiphosphate synthase [Clostridia bacterium]